MASEGEAAVAAMLQASRQTFEALRQGDEATRADRVQVAHAEYEQHWSRVRAAAQVLDASEAGETPAPTENAAPSEVDALQRERSELRGALASRNRELKDQIDRLRQLLFAVQVSSGEQK